MRTPHNNLIIPAVEDKAALATSFLKGLIQLIPAQDSYGLRESNVDDELLAEFIAIQERPGLVASPIIMMSPEGFRTCASHDRAVGRSVEDPARRPPIWFCDGSQTRQGRDQTGG